MTSTIMAADLRAVGPPLPATEPFRNLHVPLRLFLCNYSNADLGTIQDKATKEVGETLYTQSGWWSQSVFGELPVELIPVTKPSSVAHDIKRKATVIKDRAEDILDDTKTPDQDDFIRWWRDFDAELARPDVFTRKNARIRGILLTNPYFELKSENWYEHKSTSQAESRAEESGLRLAALNKRGPLSRVRALFDWIDGKPAQKETWPLFSFAELLLRDFESSQKEAYPFDAPDPVPYATIASYLRGTRLHFDTRRKLLDLLVDEDERKSAAFGAAIVATRALVEFDVKKEGDNFFTRAQAVATAFLDNVCNRYIMGVVPGGPRQGITNVAEMATQFAECCAGYQFSNIQGLELRDYIDGFDIINYMAQFRYPGHLKSRVFYYEADTNLGEKLFAIHPKQRLIKYYALKPLTREAKIRYRNDEESKQDVKRKLPHGAGSGTDKEEQEQQGSHKKQLIRKTVLPEDILKHSVFPFLRSKYWRKGD